MQNVPQHPCVNTLFHWETPGNRRFDLFINKKFDEPNKLS